MLKTPAVDAPIDLTWRTVDAYQKALRATTWEGRLHKGAELNFGLTFGRKN